MTTSPPSAPIDICKLALSLMGERSGLISSIETPTTRVENIMALWYDQCRRQVLRDTVWNFAQKERTLTRSGDGEDTWDDAYDLPNDFIRLNRVGSDPYYPITDYGTGDRKLFANNGTTLPIVYNRDVTTVTSFDALFVNCLALMIGIKTAFEVTKKKSVVDMLSDQYKQDLPSAVGVDGQERPMRRIQHSRYLSARQGSGVLTRDNRYYEIE